MKWLKRLKESRFLSRSTRYLPHLHFWLDLNIVQIRTALYYENFNNCTQEWVMVETTLFHKWGFRFRLYSPYRCKHG